MKLDLDKVNVELMKRNCMQLGVHIDIETIDAGQSVAFLLAKALRWHYTSEISKAGKAGYECDICGGYSTADASKCPYCGADGIALS